MRAMSSWLWFSPKHPTGNPDLQVSFTSHLKHITWSYQNIRWQLINDVHSYQLHNLSIPARSLMIPRTAIALADHNVRWATQSLPKSPRMFICTVLVCTISSTTTTRRALPRKVVRTPWSTWKEIATFICSTQIPKQRRTWSWGVTVRSWRDKPITKMDSASP